MRKHTHGKNSEGILENRGYKNRNGWLIVVANGSRIKK